MFKKAVLVVLTSFTIQGPPPSYYYESYGANQLYKDEGSAVRTTTGKDVLLGVSKENCAEACVRMDLKCECCNSFSFKPQGGVCYLKKRADGASEEIVTSENGYQSFKYFGLVGLGYTLEGGKLPETVKYGMSGLTDPYGYYQIAYVANSLNQVAVEEGDELETSEGREFMGYVSTARCAEECEKVEGCQGFSYNPYQQSGKCYLKTNMENKYVTEFNKDGWTTYWRESGDDLDKVFDKCFCPCKNNYVCVVCDQTYKKCNQNL
eukprot:TRINITY_DN22718_c0_g1_i3.p2 TRINITY_DN22718_c0_g1~~TRINITY_DN22718_c0_g1_i3.p2  ORF type:complete len:264 (-),score=35.45 TRINITY_DN22718_c0_g1_i3:143-934(-)